MNAPETPATIRPLRIEDADEIAKIYSAITQKTARTDFKRLIRQHAQNEEEACLVAEIDGRVVGFMISYILTLGFGIEKSAWIATLGVNPAHMGEGIGNRLATEIMDIYRERGIRNVYTSVRWDSTDLLSFFKNLGFNRSNFINLRKVME
ncbi:MAG: GNAT family N-acetyltransferase [Desulfobacteraceae bacterium]|jgi:ribosomal protein S18 acetylase RimI-like enzyme|nr:GNAT family N-acetyltransferase [Desulfobacteraceae bacterium]